MKTIRLLMCAALPALFAACADNDLVSSPSVEAQDGNLVKLEKGFALAITRGSEAETRTAWQLGSLTGNFNYSWIPDLDGSNNIIPENIGLAWRGEVGDAQVRTNYMFTLAGYLEKGDTDPKFRSCNGVLAIENGYVFGTTSANKIGLMEYNAANHDMSTKSDYALEATQGEWKLKKSNSDVENMYDADKITEKKAPNVRTGLFTTTNSTIFEGDYIVYFPYNPSFAKIGHLPATSDAEFTMDVEKENNLMAHMTGKTFAYGVAPMKGGQMAEGFKVKNLSSVIGLDLVNHTGAQQKVAKVILYDEDEESTGFYTSVGLDAEKISTEAGDRTTGKALYVVDENTEYSPTLILNFVTGSTKTHVEIEDGESQSGVLAALPVNLKKPVAYVMFESGLSVRKELEPKELVGGDAKKWEITLTEEDVLSKNLVRIAVDSKSFLQAWIGINGAGASARPGSIQILGNITFDSQTVVQDPDASNREYKFNIPTDGDGLLLRRNTTITGKGTITIPEDVTCYVKGFGNTENDAPTLTIENPIVIKSAGCCGARPGRLVLGNAKEKHAIYMVQSTVTNYGRMVVGGNSGWGQYTFEEGIQNRYDSENGYAGEVYFAGCEPEEGKSTKGTNIVLKKNVENEGFVCVQDSVFDIPNNKWEKRNTKTPGVTVTAEGGINNSTGESRLQVRPKSRLNLKGSSVNNGEIEINAKGQGAAQSEDGTIELDGGTLDNNGHIHNQGVFQNTKGTLNLNPDSEFVDFVGSQYGGHKATIKGGQYVCEVDDARRAGGAGAPANVGDRLAYALEENMPTTVVRFVKSTDNDATYTYNLNNYRGYEGTDEEPGKLRTVKFEFDGDEDFVIQNDGDNSDIRNFGTGVTVKNAKSVKFGMTTPTDKTKGIKINGDLVGLEEEGENTDGYTIEILAMSKTAAFSGTKRDLEVTGNVSLAKDAKLKVAKYGRFEIGKKSENIGNLTIGEGAEAEFDYSSYTEVGGDIAIDGKFTRILSSGVSTANPAKVWCHDYTKGSKGETVNAAPETR